MIGWLVGWLVGFEQISFGWQVLDCFNNNFSGPLPPDLWKIPSLKHLSLAGNYFDGNIPVEYGSFPSLVYLAISGNSLTGVIPEELGNLSGKNLFLTFVSGSKNYILHSLYLHVNITIRYPSLIHAVSVQENVVFLKQKTATHDTCEV